MEKRLVVLFGLLGAIAGTILLLLLLLRDAPRPRLPEVTAPPDRAAAPAPDADRPVAQSGKLHGVVIDGESEQPIPGATVRALAPRTRKTNDDVPRWGDLEVIRTVTTDGVGRFELEALPPDFWNLFVTRRGWSWTTVPRARFDQTHEIRLFRGATVRGRVLLPDQSPAAGVRILYTPQETQSEVFSFYEAFRRTFDIRTGADGTFEYVDLPTGKFTVEVYPDDYLPAPWTAPAPLKPGEVRDLGTKILDRGFGMRVRVVTHETDLPVEGAKVVVRPLVDPMPRTKTGQTRFTDAKGIAVFQGLGGQVVPNAQFVVTVVDPDLGPIPPDDPRPRSPGEEVEIRLRGAKGTVKGRVLRPNGDPLEQFYVTMEPVGHSRRPIPVWGENGGFTVAGIPTGTYQLLVRYGNLVDATVDRVEVRSGETTDVGTLTMQLGAEIRGTVRRANGKPIEKTVKVVLARRIGEGDYRTVRIAFCQKDGTYSLRGVPTGDFVLQPSDGGVQTTDPVDVTVPEGTGFLEKDLLLHGVGHLRLSFLDLVDGRPTVVMQPPVWLVERSTGRTIRWFSEGTPLRPGAYGILVDLRAGDSDPRRYEAGEAQVQEGEPADPIVVRLNEMREQ